MNTEPLVSVVIPAYNAERFLLKALRSAQRQTHSHLEILVINDGSTDRTCLIAEELAAGDVRFRVITVPNGGVARARNLGIAQASGEYVAFLDADDLWHPQKVEMQIKALTRSEGLDSAASFAFMRVIDTKDRVINEGVKLRCHGYSFTRHLYLRPVGNGSSLLIRRDVALSLGGYDTERDSCEDLDFELRLASKYPVIPVDLFLVGYRAYPGNMSSNTLKMARNVMKIIEENLLAHPEFPGWAIRGIRASTAEYVLSLYMQEGRWRLFARQFARLVVLDVRRSIEFCARAMAREIANLLRPSQLRIRKIDGRPFMEDLSPDFDQSKAPRLRDRRMVEKLTALDSELHAKLVQSSPRSKSDTLA